MSERSPAAASYRVEVSGWDAQDGFFVEKTTLEWDESGEKRVLLRSQVASGAVVFVRLLDPSGRQAIPVAYHVLGVGRAEVRGTYEIQIAPVRQNRDVQPRADTMITNSTGDED
ncbi:MAG: hypothetical protein K6U09_05905 [Acidobacteriia bacterium]|jgi:hypothetical protein|nr:hypothetical protein [Terriglobia bacterium]